MVYVIDSGIFVEHEDFEGRAKWGSTVIKGEPDFDEFGHGTHVAGIIASRRFGVAKAANVTAVKVVGADGLGHLRSRSTLGGFRCKTSFRRSGSGSAEQWHH